RPRNAPVTRRSSAGNAGVTARIPRLPTVARLIEPTKEAQMELPAGPPAGTGLTRREILKRGSAAAAAATIPSLLQARPAAGGSGSSKLKVAMMLNQNGQAITLKKDWAAAGYANLKAAKAAMKGGQGQTYAMTFPGGTHDTWLRYWLKAMGIEMSTPKIVAI